MKDQKISDNGLFEAELWTLTTFEGVESQDSTGFSLIFDIIDRIPFGKERFDAIIERYTTRFKDHPDFEMTKAKISELVNEYETDLAKARDLKLEYERNLAALNLDVEKKRLSSLIKGFNLKGK